MVDKTVHKTWLLDGLFHSAPGFITLENGLFSFALVDTGTFSKKRMAKFEQYNELNGTFNKLRAEEVVEIIKIDLNKITAKFPWYNFMGGAVLTFPEHNQKMQLSFMQPQNTKFPYHRIDNGLVQLMAIDKGLSDLAAGRAFGKAFQSILNDQKV